MAASRQFNQRSVSSFEAVRQVFLSLSIPVVEFVVLRLWVKYGLNLKLGWRYFTDFDFIFPVPFALALAFYVWGKDRPIEIRLRPKMLSLNLALFISFAVVASRFDSLSLFSPFLAALCFTFSGVLVLGTGFLSTIRFRQILTHPQSWLVIPCLLVATLGVHGKMALSWFWPILSGAAASASCSLLNVTLGNVSCLTTELHGPRMILRHDLLTIAVGKGCGGLDGILLFIYLTFVVQMLRPKLFSSFGWFLFTVGGLALMFVVNVARICLFFAIAVIGRFMFDSNESVDLMLVLFHTHAGWILFAGGIFYYYRAAVRAFHPQLKLGRAVA